MNKDHLPDDEIFMARFKNQLDLEPAPNWTLRSQKVFPWLELGWACAATLLLALYWTELRFGFFTLRTLLQQELSWIPLRWLYMAVAGAGGLYMWFKAKIVQVL